MISQINSVFVYNFYEYLHLRKCALWACWAIIKRRVLCPVRLKSLNRSEFVWACYKITMKQNPFLSNENIFSKVPARKTTTVDTSAMASSPLQIGSSYQNTLSSFSNYGYSQQQYVSPMPSSRPNVSPNPPSFQSNGYSDSFGHKDPYVSSSVGSYQQTRQDNRTSIYDQIPQYTSAYSKVSEGSLGEPILSSR